MLLPLNENDLDTILAWRNQAEVRAFSFNDAMITQAEHYRWWDTIKNDPTKQWMLYFQNNEAVGVVNYYAIKAQQEAFWGFYFSEQFAGYEKLKIWFTLEQEAINYAFDTLKVERLKCEVFKMNKAALIMHKKKGYQVIDSYEHTRGEVIVLQIEKPSI